MSADIRSRLQNLVWQAIKPDRHPHAIWSVRSEADIADGLSFARSNGKRVSIVSGGHSYIGNGIQDDSVVLDLAGLTDHAIDRDRRRGSVQPGVRIAAFDAALEAADLAFPIGHDPNVGLVGYLLGGGIGWNPNRWGMACAYVTAAEIVLASGERVTADRDRHVDLFWAVRGAGPNFCGVITRLHIDLLPRPAAIFKSVYEYSIDALDSVLAWLARLHHGLDERIELSLTFAAAIDGTATLCIVSAVFFTDTAEEANALGEPFARSAPEHGLVSRRELMPRSFRMLLDETKGDGALRHAVETLWTDDPLAAARLAATAIGLAPSHRSIVDIGFRRSAGLPSDAACSVAGRGFVFIDAMWMAEADDARNRQWTDDLVAALQPLEKGAYVNETDWIRHPQRLARCYSAEALDRLRAVKRRYDPTDLFITPIGLG